MSDLIKKQIQKAAMEMIGTDNQAIGELHENLYVNCFDAMNDAGMSVPTVAGVLELVKTELLLNLIAEQEK